MPIVNAANRRGFESMVYGIDQAYRASYCKQGPLRYKGALRGFSALLIGTYIYT